jgi:hypothetical protein
MNGVPYFQNAATRSVLPLRAHDNYQAIAETLPHYERSKCNQYWFDRSSGVVRVVKIQGETDNLDDVTFWARVFVGTHEYHIIVETTREAIRYALCSPFRDVRELAARHELATPDLVAMAASDESADIRRIAASHPVCPVGVRDCLLGDANEFVRRAVVARVDVTAEQVRRGLKDKDAIVRMMSAERCRSVDDLIIALTDKVWYVREAAVRNPLLPVGMCQMMRGDADGAVAAAAERRVKERT